MNTINVQQPPIVIANPEPLKQLETPAQEAQPPKPVSIDNQPFLNLYQSTRKWAGNVSESTRTWAACITDKSTKHMQKQIELLNSLDPKAFNITLAATAVTAVAFSYFALPLLQFSPGSTPATPEIPVQVPFANQTGPTNTTIDNNVWLSPLMPEAPVSVDSLDIPVRDIVVSHIQDTNANANIDYTIYVAIVKIASEILDMDGVKPLTAYYNVNKSSVPFILAAIQQIASASLQVLAITNEDVCEQLNTALLTPTSASDPDSTLKEYLQNFARSYTKFVANTKEVAVARQYIQSAEELCNGLFDASVHQLRT